MIESIQLRGLQDALEKQGMFETIDTSIGNAYSNKGKEEQRRAEVAPLQRPENLPWRAWVGELGGRYIDAEEKGAPPEELAKLQAETEAALNMVDRIYSDPKANAELERLKRETDNEINLLTGKLRSAGEEVIATDQRQSADPINQLRKKMIVDYVRANPGKLGLKSAPRIMTIPTKEEQDAFDNMTPYDRVLAAAKNPYFLITTVPDYMGTRGMPLSAYMMPGRSTAAYPFANAIYLRPGMDSPGAVAHEFGHIGDDVAHASDAINYDAAYMGGDEVPAERNASTIGGQVAYDATQPDYFWVPKGAGDFWAQDTRAMNDKIRMSRQEADAQAFIGLPTYQLGAQIKAQQDKFDRRKAQLFKEEDYFNYRRGLDKEDLRRESEMRYRWAGAVPRQAQWIEDNRRMSRQRPAFRGMKDEHFGPGPEPWVMKEILPAWKK